MNSETTIEQAVDTALGFRQPRSEGTPSPSLLLGNVRGTRARRSTCCRGALRFPNAEETEKYGGRLVCRICGRPQD